jgi:hypothetical protein
VTTLTSLACNRGSKAHSESPAASTGYLLTDYFSGETLASVRTDQVCAAGDVLTSPPHGLKRGEECCPIYHLRLQADKRPCGKSKASSASGDLLRREQRPEKAEGAGNLQKRPRRSDASFTAAVKKKHNELR